QEFLRFALSVFERTWMFSGRFSAIPSWSWCIRPVGKGFVPKLEPQKGAAYGYRIGGTFMSPVGVHKQGDTVPVSK
ncbi:hypothetical protein, partial [Eubacterium sp. BIOML-A2]|uniref:hypothetical protein n=1 Tax=Eubacterium sp. BIOML-A2 TaxID=2584644 RepID=UPI0019D5D07D